MCNFSSDVSVLQSVINYTFHNLRFLQDALTHPSCKQKNNYIFNYERLEFLGDAVLGFVIAEFVFKKFSNYKVGYLSKIKSFLVSKEILVRIANVISLQNYIIMTSGEEKSGGRFNENNLENAMESLLAAIYLDSNIDNVRTVILFLYKDIIYDIDLGCIDPKSTLQEFVQGNKKYIDQCPTYHVLNCFGPAHNPIFTIKVNVDGYSVVTNGKSVKSAEREAAKQLLFKLRSIV